MDWGGINIYVTGVIGNAARYGEVVWQGFDLQISMKHRVKGDFNYETIMAFERHDSTDGVASGYHSY